MRQNHKERHAERRQKIGKHIRIVVRKASRQTPIFQLKIGFGSYQALVANILPCYIDQITGYRWQNQPPNSNEFTCKLMPFDPSAIPTSRLLSVRQPAATRGEKRISPLPPSPCRVRWQHQWLAMEMTTEWETKWFARVPFQHNGWVVSNRWCLTLRLRDSAPTCENASKA